MINNFSIFKYIAVILFKCSVFTTGVLYLSVCSYTVYYNTRNMSQWVFIKWGWWMMQKENTKPKKISRGKYINTYIFKLCCYFFTNLFSFLFISFFMYLHYTIYPPFFHTLGLNSLLQSSNLSLVINVMNDDVEHCNWQRNFIFFFGFSV